MSRNRGACDCLCDEEFIDALEINRSSNVIGALTEIALRLCSKYQPDTDIGGGANPLLMFKSPRPPILIVLKNAKMKFPNRLSNERRQS